MGANGSSRAAASAFAVESLAVRCQRALERTGLERLALGGGVAANAALRARVRELGVEVHVPPRELCTDNAAMIAYAGSHRLARGERDGWDLAVASRTALERVTRKGGGRR